MKEKGKENEKEKGKENSKFSFVIIIIGSMRKTQSRPEPSTRG